MERSLGTSQYTFDYFRPIDGEGVELKIDTDGCEETDNPVQFLEHVQVGS